VSSRAETLGWINQSPARYEIIAAKPRLFNVARRTSRSICATWTLVEALAVAKQQEVPQRRSTRQHAARDWRKYPERVLERFL